MKYFDKDFLQFFKDLAANNNRDFFQEQKKRYEQSVKNPFEKFIGDAIEAIGKKDKTVRIKPSEAIFRINRDVRFSKDKTPYKLNTSAVIANGGRKSEGASGIYVELGPEKLAFATGIYAPDKNLLAGIRQLLAKNPKAFMKILDDKAFKKIWGELQGEKNKIIPSEFKKAGEICPHIYNKQFYCWVELEPEIILTDKLMPLLLNHFEASQNFSSFLSGALTIQPSKK